MSQPPPAADPAKAWAATATDRAPAMAPAAAPAPADQPEHKTTPDPASPCTGICRISESSGFCEGCSRSLVEIATWSSLSKAARAAILATLPTRQSS